LRPKEVLLAAKDQGGGGKGAAEETETQNGRVFSGSGKDKRDWGGRRGGEMGGYLKGGPPPLKISLAQRKNAKKKKSDSKGGLRAFGKKILPGKKGQGEEKASTEKWAIHGGKKKGSSQRSRKRDQVP